MTITREEFKELVALYKKAFNQSIEMSAYYNEEITDNMIFPVFHWISQKLDLIEADGDIDVLADLVIFDRVAVDIEFFELPDGEIDYTCEYTNDLDRIYDWYLNPSKEDQDHG